jgi:plasmid stability protein
LEDATKERLRIRAAQHGRSMEEEAREILKVELKGKRTKERHLAESIRRRFAALGGVELATLKRETVNRPLKLGK